MAASTGGRGVRSSRSTDSTTDHAGAPRRAPRPATPTAGGSPVEAKNERSAFVTICPDVGTAQQRRISREHERETNDIGQANSGLRAGVPVLGLSDCGPSDPHHNNGAHDENTSTHHHT